MSLSQAQVKIGTDVAASEFYTAEKKHYDLDFKNPSSMDTWTPSRDQVEHWGYLPRFWSWDHLVKCVNRI